MKNFKREILFYWLYKGCFFDICMLKTQDWLHASQCNSQGSAFIEVNFLFFGPCIRSGAALVWGISSICDLSRLTSCLQASVHAS